MRVFLDAAMQKAQMQQVVKTVLPEAIDPFNYSGGKLVDIRRANAKKGWNILASWHPSDSASTRKGFVDVPMLVGEKPGAALKFTFSGSAAGIVVAAGPDAGRIRYRVDRGSWQEQDLYTRWSRRLHLPWYYVLAGTLDTKEQHLLEIEIMERKAGEPGGNACRIGSFFVNE
jgi:sialidase-1